MSSDTLAKETAPPEAPSLEVWDDLVKFVARRRTVVYLVGSLRSPRIVEIGTELRYRGFDVFDDWHAGGPEADDAWQRYETARGRTYTEALKGYAAQHVFQYDKSHLDRADIGVLVLPAGKSAHLELGYLRGQNKPTFILLDGAIPDRWDVMYAFCDSVVIMLEELVHELEGLQHGA